MSRAHPSSARPGLCALACAALACVTPDTSGPDGGDHGRTIGGDRPARVVLPATYDDATRWPAVFLLAGYSYSSEEIDRWLSVTAFVDRLGFVLVLPDGTVNSDGDEFWNATDTCCDYEASGVDDVGYLTGLREELLEKYAIDPKRTILVGHSNGGFLAYRLACDDADSWSAVGSLAGSMWLDEAKCRPSRPVDVLHVHGTNDRLMPYAGDDSGPGAVEVLARWAVTNGCEPEPTIDPVRVEYVDNTQEDETELQRFDCPAPARLEHWRIVRSGHEPAYRPRFTEAMLEWLLAVRRP